MSALIVGAGGFIGRHLQRALKGNGVDVIGASSQSGNGLDPATGGLRPEFSIPRGVDTVYYLAQSPRYRDPDQSGHILRVNVVSAIEVASLAHKAGAKRFIYTSTGSAYGPGFGPHKETDPLRRDNWYALTKAHAEEALALMAGKLDCTVVRLFGIYGPGQQHRLIPNLIASVSAGQPVTVEPHPADPADRGGLRISLCYIEDTVQILAALRSRTAIPCLNVANEEIWSIAEIAREIGNAVGRPPTLSIEQRARSGDLIADIGLLKEVLRPSFTSFRDGLQRTLKAGRSD